MKWWVYFKQTDPNKDCGIRVRLCFDTLSERGYYAEYRKQGTHEWKRYDNG